MTLNTPDLGQLWDVLSISRSQNEARRLAFARCKIVNCLRCEWLNLIASPDACLLECEKGENVARWEHAARVLTDRCTARVR